MTTRTTSSQVEEILADSFIEGDSLAIFIDAANRLVSKVCVSKLYDDEDLEVIERYLAAHFYACSERQHESERADVVSRKFAGAFDKGLDFTQFGQMAKRLAYQGELSQLDKGQARKVSMSWLGSSPTDEHWYFVDRT